MNRDVAIRIADGLAVRRANGLAFSRHWKADPVDRLLAGCPRLVSLLAVAGSQLAGHVLFSPAVVEGSHGSLAGMGLASIAVLPEFRRRGIGKALPEAGIGEDPGPRRALRDRPESSRKVPLSFASRITASGVSMRACPTGPL
jgi:GNAT superfamily N-acetyltransferase